MFKVAVVVFALAISGFMLWVAHEDSNFAGLPHATLVSGRRDKAHMRFPLIRVIPG